MLSHLGLGRLGSSLQLGHEPTGWSGQEPLFCVAHWRHLNYSTIRCSWQSRCFTAIGIFFSLHTSGHSVEKSCITETQEAQVRSKSWCWSVSKPFLQTWYFCWQVFCWCPVLHPLSLVLSIYWEKWFLAEEEKSINAWWNNEGAGEAALSQRAVGVGYSQWAQPDFCLCFSLLRIKGVMSQHICTAINGRSPTHARLGFAPVFTWLVKIYLPFFLHLNFDKSQSGEILIWNVCSEPLIALSQWEAVINFNPLNAQMQIQKSELIYFAGISRGLWNRKLRAQ